jgi:hypothetical protein
MRQSRASSLIEALANVAIGYGINVLANFAIFPLFGWHITLRQNLLMGIFYTAVSITRSYVVRRWFNRWLHRQLTTSRSAP